MDATTVAVDLAKMEFEVAIADRHWHIAARHRFKRQQFTKFLATASATDVVMEACGTAHYCGAVRATPRSCREESIYTPASSPW